MAKSPHFAGFWIRFLAYVIDFVILSFALPLVGIHSRGISMIPLAIYFGAFWLWKAATPGSMLLGMRVVSVDGKKLTATQVLLRLVGYVVSSVLFGIGFIWIAFDAQKQGWADKIAKTYVVKND